MPNNLAAAALGQTPTMDAAAPTAAPAVPGGAPPGQQPGAPAAPSGAPGKQYTLQEVKDAIRKQGIIDHEMRTMLASGKPVPKKDAISLGVSLVSKRVLSAEEMAGYFATLPDDPMEVREWLAKHAEKVEANLDQMFQMIHGQEQPPAAPPMPAVSGDLMA